ALSCNAWANEPAPSCPPPPAMPEAAKMQELAKNAKDRGFLWKISKDGRSSYLYGTIHTNTLDWMMFGPKTMAAIRESDAIAVELNPLDPEVQSAMLDPEKQGIKSPPLNDALKARLNTLLKRTCAPLQFFEKQPAMMQVAGAMMFDARFIGLEASYGSEMFLIGLAQGAKKPLASLETAARQMRALVGNDTSTDMIESSLAQVETGKARKMLSRMHAAWGAGNANDFDNMGAWCECLDTETDRKYMQRLNDDRNPDLAKGIDKLHGEGKRVFAAVGTLHMFGAKGLPKLMRDMGYTVERVAYEK
ncbi:MAG: TraB/GumN family protein, partial [Casimicrobium sp.]